MAYPATPKTWVAGDVLTAAQLNAELRDALLAAFPLGVDAWTAWTPTLTQSATVTKTVTYARYQRIGRTILYAMRLVVTGAGTAGNVVRIGLPPPLVVTTDERAVGMGQLFDASAGLLYRAVAVTLDNDEIALGPTDGTVANFLGVTGFAAALASGDVILASGQYEAAT